MDLERIAPKYKTAHNRGKASNFDELYRLLNRPSVCENRRKPDKGHANKHHQGSLHDLKT